MQIKIEYGGNELSVNVADGTSIAQVMNNANYQAVLGYAGESVEAIVDGTTQPGGTTLRDGDTVLFQTKAATKG